LTLSSQPARKLARCDPERNIEIDETASLSPRESRDLVAADDADALFRAPKDIRTLEANWINDRSQRHPFRAIDSHIRNTICTELRPRNEKKISFE
jgi:hypothetical protein